jgi:hypothetical protein
MGNVNRISDLKKRREKKKTILSPYKRLKAIYLFAKKKKYFCKSLILFAKLLWFHSTGLPSFNLPLRKVTKK